MSATAAELPHYAKAFHGEPLSDDGEARWRELLRARVEGLLAAAESATTAADDEALMEALPERKGARGPRSRRATARSGCCATRWRSWGGRVAVAG